MDDVMAGEAPFRWMTYAELGQARGISTSSATRLAFRRKWKRQRGNDRTARVAVPLGEDQPSRDDRDDATGDDRGDAMLAAVAALRERAERAEARIDRAERLADEEREGRTRAELALAGERGRADALRDRIDALQADLASLRAQLEQAKRLKVGPLKWLDAALARVRGG